MSSAKPSDAEVRAAWEALEDEDDRRALVHGAGLDRPALIEAGLVRESYRTNRSGETKFNGRRTPFGRRVAAYGKGVMYPSKEGSADSE